MRELNINEIALVSGGDVGDATVAGGIAGATAGYRIAQGTLWGARVGGVVGPAGIFVGGLLGAIAAFTTYQVAVSFAN